MKMGKTKKLKPSQAAARSTLEQDIESAKFVKPKNRNKIRFRKDEDEQVSFSIFGKTERFGFEINIIVLFLNQLVFVLYVIF